MPAWVVPAIAAAGQVIGGAVAKGRGERQIDTQRQLNIMAMGHQKEMAEWNNEQQLKMWEATGPQGQMKQLKKAGLNPALMYGGSGAGGSTQAAQAAGPTTAMAPAGSGQEEQQYTSMAMGLASQMRLLEAQAKNIEADTKLKEEQTETQGYEQVIKNFNGQEIKDMYELVKKPNRGNEEKAWMHENEARQAVGETMYELWLEGKLKEKSLAEIESIMVNNSKTREQTKQITKTIDLLEKQITGKDLENAILEIEKKLQETTGLDKNSPYWAKMIGRLLIKIMGE